MLLFYRSDASHLTLGTRDFKGQTDVERRRLLIYPEIQKKG